MFLRLFNPSALASHLHFNSIVLALGLANLFFNIVANSSFKMSASSSNLRGFIIWQVVGNLAGFITVLTLTGLLRYLPLHVAYPATTGLAIVGVTLVSGRLLFGEAVGAGDWLGALLVVLGIFFLTRGE